MYQIMLNGTLYAEIHARSARAALRKFRRIQVNPYAYTFKRHKLVNRFGAEYCAVKVG